MPTSTGPNIIENGLILALDASDTTSYIPNDTTWFDLSGNNNGTLINDPIYDSANAGSIGFDGANSSAQLSNDTRYNIQDITVSVWVYQSEPNSYNPIIVRYGQTTNYNGWSISYAPATSKFSWGGRESIALYINAATVNTYAVDRWHNVVGTKLANTWAIYVNGILDTSTTAGLGNVSFLTSNMNLAADVGAAYNNYGACKIANTQIYNRALSATEILQNYNAVKNRFGLK
jgi:hypothetical protein